MISDCIFFFFSARPSAPKELKFGAITRDSVHLTWEPPDDDGGSPLTGYVVEKREVSRKTWTKVSFEQQLQKREWGKSRNVEMPCKVFMFLPLPC